jgi:hypothetical protein
MFSSMCVHGCRAVPCCCYNSSVIAHKPLEAQLAASLLFEGFGG